MTSERSRLALIAILTAGVLVRLATVGGPGFTSDVGTFMAWAERLADRGPWGFYEPGYFADYPPAFLYGLWLLGLVLDGEALRLAVKAISIPFDVGIALLLHRVAGARGAWVGTVAAALWMLAPGPVLAGPFWGQVDAVGTLAFLAALVVAGAGRWGWAGVLAATAAL
ncbi:MAG: hypothetical protein FJ034_05965, partial [Chloroflexi bacterium]|nr:hypothetical protein [Chloroflexota bacterium]